MRIIKAQSVNDAFHAGAMHLYVFGVDMPSRNGPVYVSPSPVVTVFEHPERRVLVSKDRDANPFFHLFESLWMLAGRNDLEFPKKFVSTFNRFSDDGETLWGAYGYRWRNWFGYDQLDYIVEDLKTNPHSRRAVLQMWNAFEHHECGVTLESDLERAAAGGKDVPCNTAAFFDTIDGRLNMTVTCRSNDMVLGAYGANAVHFSILLEWLSTATGIPMGVYRQMSNNFHAYTELYKDMVPDREGLAKLGKAVLAADHYGVPGPLTTMVYGGDEAETMPLIRPYESASMFQADCERFCEQVLDDSITWLNDENYVTVFFDDVVLPMYHTWMQWKNKRFDLADQEAQNILAPDWRGGAKSWLDTRRANRAAKENS